MSKEAMANWLEVLFLILAIDSTILGIIGSPISNTTAGDGHGSNGSMTTTKYDAITPQAQELGIHKDKKEMKKLKKRDLFNSFLCGVGYIYNPKLAICVFTKEGQIYPSADETESTTSKSSSVETLEYFNENRSKISMPENRLLPLECGMNYRYLKKAKICKSIMAPKSSESDENGNENSSEE